MQQSGTKTQTTVFLAPIGSGVGDVIVCLPAFRWLIQNEKRPVYLVARSTRQLGFDELIDGLAGTVKEPDVSLNDGDLWINLRDHELQTRWDWTTPDFQKRFPNANIGSILQTICNDKGIYCDFEAQQKMPFVNDQRSAGKLLLIPGTTALNKHLLPQTWHELIGKLNNAGIDFAILGEPEHSSIVKELIASGHPHIHTPTIVDAVNVISSCRSVISVDTGMMHIASDQGIPTIVIQSKISVYFRPRSNCFPIYASEAPPPSAHAENNFPTTYSKFTWWCGSDYPGAKPIASVSADDIWNTMVDRLQF